MKLEDIRDFVRTGNTGRQLQPADKFWAEFRRRAENPAIVRNMEPVPRRMRWNAWKASPLIAAAAALLVAVVWIGNAPGAAYPGAIQSYDIGADVAHNGVMILDDTPSQATILWIMDCSEEHDHTIEAEKEVAK